MTDYNWLQKLCSNRADCWTSKPFRLSWQDKDWVGATNGVGLIVIEGQSDFQVPENPVVISILEAAMGYTENRDAELTEFKQYLETPAWHCENCHGNGHMENSKCLTCNGEGKVQCDHDHDHCDSESVCKSCDGRGHDICMVCNGIGVIGDKSYREGIICKIPINRNILAQYLHYVSTNTGKVSIKTHVIKDKLKPLAVFGNNWDNWIILISPLSHTFGDAPEFNI